MTYEASAIKLPCRRTMMIKLALPILVLITTSANMVSAGAAEIKVFTSRAIATVLAKIGPEFERTTGNKLNVITGFSPVFVRQITAGEPFDVIASPPGTISVLARDGRVIADSRIRLVRAGYGIGVRAGAPKPDISSVEAFKLALLNAKTIGYLPTPGVPELLARLKLADAVKSKATVPNTDIVSELVAKGELELAIVVMTQILTTPGVELVGPLPPEIQIYTVFEGAVSAGSQASEAARDLLKILTGPAAIPTIKEQGMEPG
jgi:molybdate transport system substrate-binding protein